MCLDISFHSALELIDEYFPDLVHDQEFDFDLDMGAHVLAVDHGRYPIVTHAEGKHHLHFFEWGVIADYMNTPDKIKMQRRSMVNARSEKITDDNRSFWNRIRNNRCLIPVEGIFEHREIKGWKNKVPYYIRLKNRKLFCIPGLYYFNERIPSDPETGEMIGMFALVTRMGNKVMEQIHNSGDNAFRMPVMLPKELEIKWLQPDLTDDQIKDILNYEMPSEEMEYSTVWTIRTTKPRPDGKSKIDTFEWPSLPPLGNDDATLQKSLF